MEYISLFRNIETGDYVILRNSEEDDLKLYGYVVIMQIVTQNSLIAHDKIIRECLERFDNYVYLTAIHLSGDPQDIIGVIYENV